MDFLDTGISHTGIIAQAEITASRQKQVPERTTAAPALAALTQATRTGHMSALYEFEPNSSFSSRRTRRVSRVPCRLPSMLSLEEHLRKVQDRFLPILVVGDGDMGYSSYMPPQGLAALPGGRLRPFIAGDGWQSVAAAPPADRDPFPRGAQHRSSSTTSFRGGIFSCILGFRHLPVRGRVVTCSVIGFASKFLRPGNP